MNWLELREKEINKLCLDCLNNTKCIYKQQVKFSGSKFCSHRKLPTDKKRTKIKKWSGYSNRYKGAYERF